MRTITTLAVTITVSLGLTQSAQATDYRPECPTKLLRSANHHREIVIERHGKRAPGRDIIRDGRIGPNQRPHAVRDCGKIRRYRDQLIQLHTEPKQAPLIYRTAVDPARAPAGVQTPSVAAGGTLEAIAQCESGGDPGAIGGGGLYRGKYQFDFGTWASVGGSGDPAAASEAEQDMRAARLYSQRGAQPWPECGR